MTEQFASVSKVENIYHANQKFLQHLPTNVVLPWILYILPVKGYGTSEDFIPEMYSRNILKF